MEKILTHIKKIITQNKTVINLMITSDRIKKKVLKTT